MNPLERPVYGALPQRVVVTGAAGFIGSHLAETLIASGSTVVGLDNLSTGSRSNLAAIVASDHSGRFEFIEGDVRSLDDCRRALAGADCVMHQAALNSVPRSLEQPIEVAHTNVLGTATLLAASAEAGIDHFLYASSSSVYGDIADVVRTEGQTGSALSPYAASKQSAESFSGCYHRLGAFDVTGFRYFNVFGPRQNKDGPYSAVIPRWIDDLLERRAPRIFGTGHQSRDFTHVSNVVHANLLACTRRAARGEVLNVGTGHPTTLLELFTMLRDCVADVTGSPDLPHIEAVLEPPRRGDVHSALADTTKIGSLLDYRPITGITDGLANTVSHFFAAKQVKVHSAVPVVTPGRD